MFRLATPLRSINTVRTFSNGRYVVPRFGNEPFQHYAPGSSEREALIESLAKTKSEVIDIPCVVGGQDVYTGNIVEQVMPTNHSHVLARIHYGDEKIAQAAFDAAQQARHDWTNTPYEHRAAVFLKAADLLADQRYDIMASVMLGTGKNTWQAEIDAAVETIDFLRLNTGYAEEIYEGQPEETTAATWNRMQYRALEGVVLAMTPFNFLAIAANLACSPAMMGNTVVWKPSTTAALGNYKVMQILREAGLPDGVINFVPGDGPTVGGTCMSNPNFAGLHFTGSTGTFNTLWNQIGQNLPKYRAYPRVVGETGGKNFHFVHESADVETVVNQTIRGAFEYSGQKCSAASRAYFPESLWPAIKEGLVQGASAIKVGQPDDFSTFMTSVIDRTAYDKITGAIDRASASPECEIIHGGTYDDSQGYFIAPTIIVTSNPRYETMETELFGPVLTVYVYDGEKYEDALALCDSTSQFGLTGSLFARDRNAIVKGEKALENASGNFYINDKSTGAIVGQQPFGGARMSGTNDKAGSYLNLLRWTSPRAIKETFVPLREYTYPSNEE